MNRSKKFVFLPFCVLSQAYQAQTIVKYEWSSSIKPILQFLMDNDINIIQMPCPESSFGGYDKSLIRPPRNIEGYDNDEYKNHCKKLAEGVIDMIKPMIESGYEIIAILGIGKSPSCSNSLVHTDNGGLVERKGIFMDEISRFVKENNLDIPIIEVNKKDVSVTLEALKKITTLNGNKN